MVWCLPIKGWIPLVSIVQMTWLSWNLPHLHRWSIFGSLEKQQNNCVRTSLLLEIIGQWLINWWYDFLIGESLNNKSDRIFLEATSQWASFFCFQLRRHSYITPLIFFFELTEQIYQSFGSSKLFPSMTTILRQWLQLRHCRTKHGIHIRDF